MANLYLISRSCFQSKTPETAISRAGPNDAFMFIGDGVYSVLPSSSIFSSIKARETFALVDDAAARGLIQKIPQSHLIDFEQFVDLTLRYDRVISWY